MSGKARFGLALETTLIFDPRVTDPSTLITPESHEGQLAASTSRGQIASGEAWIEIDD